MRPILKNLLFTIPLLLFVQACTSNTPEDVSKAFLSALADGDYDDAMDYASPKMQHFLKNSQSFGGVPENPNFSFTFLKLSKEGNHTRVYYRDNQERNRSITLILIDKNYRVDYE